VVDNNGNVYVTGKSFGSGTYYDYATIKYSSTGRVEESKKDKGLLRDRKTIYTELKRSGILNLKIYNPPW